MKLVRLEIRGYRSIKEQTESKSILLNGLDCLVGRNNAGKSNILEAVLYLLGGVRYSQDLHHGLDPSRVVDVRGYFRVDESDFDRLKIENKKQRMKELVLDDGTIGVCRRSDNGQMEVVGYYPKEGRLRKERFEGFYSKAWEEKKDRKDFKDRMQAEYPELTRFITRGKEENKGEWSEAYTQFIRARPDGVKFTQLPVAPPTGIPADLSNMLPRPVFVPAVKEVAEVTKTTRSAELGSLLSELSSEIHEELDEAIEQAMAEVYRRLNIVTDAGTGEAVDDRHFGVKSIERQLSHYVSETFQDVSVSLEFPNPESKVMFDNARIWIREAGFDQVPVDSVGQGVKRVLIFSVIRTLADLRQGQLSVSEDEGEDEQPEMARRPLLVLYEEAELFLHPGLQTILLKAFATLKASGDQVIFTTHSPFLLRGPLLSTINLVTKDREKGTQNIEFHSVLNQQDRRTKNRLLQLQNVSSYIFADKVVLVEGASDRIVLEKLGPALSPNWDFEQCGIPILPVAGKGDLPMFRDFLAELGIQTFIVTDLDAVKDVLLRLCREPGVRDIAGKLRTRARQLLDSGAIAPRINKRYIDRLTTGFTWKLVVEELEELCRTLHAQNSPTEEQIGCLEKLLSRCEIDAETQALECADQEIQKWRTSLVELVLEEDVLLLTGTVEDYYPGASRTNKIERALEFDARMVSRSELRSCFRPVFGGRTSDVEAFLYRVFGS